MRVGLLTDGIWPFVIGGMQKHSYYLCKYLARRGVYVDLYHTSDHPGEINLEEHFVESELKYIRSFIIPFPKQDPFPGHYLRASLAYSRRIRNVLYNNEPPDLIYAKGLTSWSLFKTNETTRPKVPVCINVHGYEYYQQCTGLKQHLQQFMLRRPFAFINRNADYIYSYGGGISSLIKSHFFEKSNYIVEIPAGISETFLVNQPARPSHPRKFVFTGRYEERKGIRELNTALRDLMSTFKFSFTFIGAVPYDLRIVDPNISYLGVLKSEHEISISLQNSDVLICPSYSEGMPNVIMEAMASGCAVIATNVGAVDLLVDSGNGWLIPAGSVSALKRSIIEALSISSEELYEKKQKSVERIRNDYLWEKVIEQHISSFKNIKEIGLPANLHNNPGFSVK